MLKRDPTRIVLDDSDASELDEVEKEKILLKFKKKSGLIGSRDKKNAATGGGKSKKRSIADRIGYNSSSQ